MTTTQMIKKRDPWGFRCCTHLLAIVTLSALSVGGAIAAQPIAEPDGSGGVVMNTQAAAEALTASVVKAELSNRPDLLLQMGWGQQIVRSTPAMESYLHLKSGGIDLTGPVFGRENYKSFMDLGFEYLRDDNGRLSRFLKDQTGYTPTQLILGSRNVLREEKTEAIVNFIPFSSDVINFADKWIIGPRFSGPTSKSTAETLQDWMSGMRSSFIEGANGAPVADQLMENYRNSKDPKFRAFVKEFVRQEFQIDLDSTDTQQLLTRNPKLSDDPMVAQIFHAITTGQDQIHISHAALENMFREGISGVRGQIGEMTESLASQGDSIRSIHQHIEEFKNGQIAAENKILEQRQYQQRIQASQSGVFLLSTLADLGGSPKLAMEISTVGNAAITIVDAISNFSDSGLFSAAGAIATGNIVGAVLSIMNLFGGSAGPPPEQIILEQIAELRQEIYEFRVEMHGRFDRVDESLNQIYQTLNDRFDRVDVQLGRIDGSLSDLKSGLYDLRGDVLRIEQKTFAYLDALSDRTLVEVIEGHLSYESNFGLPLTYSQYLLPENKFYTWSTSNARDGASSPLSGRSLTDDGLLAELTSLPFAKNLRYIDEFTHTRLGHPRLSSVPVSNPRDWALGAMAYDRLMLENPQHSKRVSKARLDLIISRGEDIASFIERMVRTGSGQANETFWNLLLSYYATQAAGVETAYRARLADYNVSKGKPAYHDPFAGFDTSEMVVARATAGSTDPGLLPHGQIEALAASPTDDGFPVYFLTGHALMKLERDRSIVRVAGEIAQSGSADGGPDTARFNRPMGLAVAKDGRVYISDSANHLVRMVDAEGVTTTLAGAAGVKGGTNGVGATARFRRPWGIAIGADDKLYICDVWNHSIRRIDPATKTVTTFAGYQGPDQRGGTKDATGNSARFFGPHGICLGQDGNFYVTDTWNHTIRRVTPAGAVTRVCGWPLASGFADAAGPWARFRMPLDITASPTGDLFVSERGSNLIRRVVPSSGRVVTPANRTGPVVSIRGLSSSFQFPVIRSDNTVNNWGIMQTGADPWQSLHTSVSQPTNNDIISVAASESAWLAIRSNGRIERGGKYLHSSSGYTDSWGGPSLSKFSHENWNDYRPPTSWSSIVVAEISLSFYHPEVTTFYYGPGGSANARWYTVEERGFIFPSRTLAVRSDGSLIGWGRAVGEYTFATSSDYTAPVISGSSVAIALDKFWDYILTDAGTVRQRSANSSGSTQTLLHTDIVGITTALNSKYFLRSDGTIVGEGNRRIPGNRSASALSISAGNKNIISISGSGEGLAVLRDVWEHPGTAPVQFYGYLADPSASGQIATHPNATRNNVLYQLGTPPAKTWGPDDDPIEIRGGLSHVAILHSTGRVELWGRRFNSNSSTTTANPPSSWRSVPSPGTGSNLSSTALSPSPRAIQLGADNLLVADSRGIRWLKSSERASAIDYLQLGMRQPGELSSASERLSGAMELVRQCALLSRWERLESGDEHHLLLFGKAAPPDKEGILDELEERRTPQWPPPARLEPLVIAAERAEVLRDTLVEGVKADVAAGDLPWYPPVHETLHRLRLTRRTLDSNGLPPPTLSLLPNIEGNTEIEVIGLPFVDFQLESSIDMKNWAPLPGYFRDGDRGPAATPNARRVYRARIVPRP